MDRIPDLDSPEYLESIKRAYADRERERAEITQQCGHIFPTDDDLDQWSLGMHYAALVLKRRH